MKIETEDRTQVKDLKHPRFHIKIMTINHNLHRLNLRDLDNLISNRMKKTGLSNPNLLRQRKIIGGEIDEIRNKITSNLGFQKEEDGIESPTKAIETKIPKVRYLIQV